MCEPVKEISITYSGIFIYINKCKAKGERSSDTYAYTFKNKLRYHPTGHITLSNLLLYISTKQYLHTCKKQRYDTIIRVYNNYGSSQHSWICSKVEKLYLELYLLVLHVKAAV